jgi:cobalt-zinc-cadmium efflux system outer membrane protein
MIRYVAAVAALACAGGAVAQDRQSGRVPLTLEAALSAARTRSPGMAAADAGDRAATAARNVARLRPNPTVEANVENVAGTGDYRGLSGAETTVALALPIELGGKRAARVAVADTRIDRARIATAVALADLELKVTQAYIAAASAERRLGVSREQATIAREALRVSSVRVTAGAAPPIDRQRSEVLAINAGTAAERAARSVELARATLTRLTGLGEIGPLDLGWFERVDGFGPVLAARSNGTLALAAASAELRTAEAQVRLAQSLRIPDVTVRAGARRLEATKDIAAVFGVSLPIPLFNNGRSAIAQARAERDQAEAQRRLARNEVEQAIEEAETEVANAAASARALRGPALAAAQEAARIARIGYAQGKFGQIELLEAERTLSETRAAATDALADFHDARARLRRLTQAAPSMAQVSGENR